MSNASEKIDQHEAPLAQMRPIEGHEPWCLPAAHAQAIREAHPGEVVPCVGRNVSTASTVLGRVVDGWWHQDDQGPRFFAERGLNNADLSIADLRVIHRVLSDLDETKLMHLRAMVAEAIMDHDWKHPGDTDD